MQQLFSHTFQDTTQEEIAPIVEKLPEINASLEKAAPEWPTSKISKIDLAILQLAIWELMYDRKTPPKVVIDEAVELGKSFGNEHSAKFINGVLGTIVKGLNSSV